MTTKRRYTKRKPVLKSDPPPQLEAEDYLILQSTFDYLRLHTVVVTIDSVTSCFINELEFTTDPILANSYRRLLNYLYKTPCKFV